MRGGSKIASPGGSLAARAKEIEIQLAALSLLLLRLHFFSRAHYVNPRSPEGRGGFAAPSGGRLPDRPLRCSASSATRLLFFVATSRTLCDVAGGSARARACVRARMCVRFLTLSFSVSLSLPLSLKTHVYHSNKKKKSI